MDDEFQDIGDNVESRFSKPIVKAIGEIVLLGIGLAGTILIAYSVQPNPQHLSIYGEENKNVQGVYDLRNTNASSTDAMVFAIINGDKFSLGTSLIMLAFSFQILVILFKATFSKENEEHHRIRVKDKEPP